MHLIQEVHLFYEIKGVEDKMQHLHEENTTIKTKIAWTVMAENYVNVSLHIFDT